MRALLVGLGLLAAAPALAESAPTPGAADPRIRTVTYSPNNVVAVEASYGTSTMIVLGEGERIETIAVGDSVAWKVEPNKRGNIIFLKPIAPKAMSNMNVVTDARLYSFVLRANDAPARGQVYKIRFRYPDEAASASLRAEAEQLVNDPNRRALNVRKANTDYGFKGSPELKPTAAFDDGTKTWFQFAGAVPAIFAVDKDGRESLVNHRREREFIVVDRISRQWTLRQGEAATCIFNLAPSQPDPTGIEGFGPTNLGSPSLGPKV